MNKRKLCKRLDELFGDVRLDGGVSISEAYVVDDNGSEIERSSARRNDETTDWRRLIGSEELTAQSLCFMDARGRLFHIPACLASLMIVDVPEEQLSIYEAVLFVLPNFNADEFELFGKRRLAIIRDILNYFRNTTDESYFRQIDDCVEVLDRGMTYCSDDTAVE